MDEFIRHYREGQLTRDALFRTFEEEFRPRVYRYLLALLSRRDLIDDIYQEFSLRLFRSLDEYVLGGNFMAWVLRLARNAALDYLRRAAKNKTGQEDLTTSISAKGPGPKTDQILKEQDAFLTRAVNELQPEIRELLYMRFYGNLTFEEISEITGCPISTIQRRLEKGMGLLHSAMKAWE